MQQLSFPCKGRGGWRPNAGRKRGDRVTHHGREPLRRPLPIHAVWHTRDDVRSLRGSRLFRQIRESFRRCCEKHGFRLVHFVVLGNHLHLIVEADDLESLSRGMQGLGVSIAKRVNLTSGRSGPVFDDRFYARHLATPTEVAKALDYVLHNEDRHAQRNGRPPPAEPFAFTSVAPAPPGRPLTAPPQTPLLCHVVLRL
jgi:REP element-mobilizing transposase RayT